MSTIPNTNRDKATAVLLDLIEEILPQSGNRDLYQSYLGGLSDDEFEAFIVSIEKDEFILPLYSPNLSESQISADRNIAIGRRLGHEFFVPLELTDATTGRTYITPRKYLVVDLPLRRQQQTLKHKISIPEDNQHIDELTGQPTGPSKGAKLSFPELLVADSLGLGNTIQELIKIRGGDERAFNAMNRQIERDGFASLKTLTFTKTQVKSKVTLSTFLKAMHLDNNL